MKRPSSHPAVMPYLMLENAAGFSVFVQTVFQAMPGMMHKDGDRIVHGELEIDGSVIMFTDSTPEWKPQTANMFIYVDNADETYQKALDTGAEKIMEPADQSYGRSCGVRDPFGNIWWITSVIGTE